MILIMFFGMLSAYGSEEMKKGDVLTEDSYVFSIEEAENLKLRIIELEKKEKELLIYKDINDLQKLKISKMEDGINYRDEYIENLKKIDKNNQLIIKEYMKKENLGQVKSFLYFSAGVAMSFGSVYLATKLGE